MFKNYFKIALRTFRKDKSFSAINMISLSFGVAITLMILHYVRYELSYENHITKSDQIVRLTTDIINGESVVYQDCETYPPLAGIVKEQIPEVKNTTRVYPIGEPSVDVEINENQYLVQKVFGVDPEFFDLFEIEFIEGSKQDLFLASREVVISESVAMKYFNSTEVVGKDFKMVSNGGKLPLTIKGVVKDAPSNTHLKYDMFISYETLNTDFGESDDNWRGNNTLTYLELEKAASYENFESNLNKLNQSLNEKDLIDDEAFIAQKIADIHLYSNKSFELEPNNEARTVYLLLVVAILVIVSALVNYVNLTTSRALDRAKEMGLRKVVGSTQSQVKSQVFVESFIMNFSAGLLALTLIVLSQSTFFEISGLPEGNSIFIDPSFWMNFGIILLVSTLFSSIYPAFILSSFKPSSVLKGSFTRSTKGVLMRKSLVIFQFTVTVILLVQAFAVYLQLDFLRGLDKGLDVEKTIVLRRPTGEGVADKFNAFKNRLTSFANIENVSFSSTVPSQPSTSFSTTTGVALADAQEENNFNYYMSQIDSSFFDALDIQFLAGNDFDATSTTLDQTFEDEENPRGNVIVNEEALRLWEIEDPSLAVQKDIRMYGKNWRIVGVVKNYNQFSPKAAQIPIIHTYNPRNSLLISVKFTSGDPESQLNLLKEEYTNSFPGKPFSYFFLDSEYDLQYKADERFQTVFGVITFFAILIACLGLFGLATFTVLKRTKEIGIRKSIGASTSSILLLLSKDFMKTVGFAILIGLPITYFLVEKWLSNFANQIELRWWVFALPIIGIFILVIISICGKTIKTAMTNPVDSLRNE